MTYTFEQYWSAFHHKFQGVSKETAKLIFSHGQLIMLEHVGNLNAKELQSENLVNVLVEKCKLTLPDKTKQKTAEPEIQETRPKTLVAMNICQILDRIKKDNTIDPLRQLEEFLCELDASRSDKAGDYAHQILSYQTGYPESPTVLEKTRLAVCQFLGVNAWI